MRHCLFAFSLALAAAPPAPAIAAPPPPPEQIQVPSELTDPTTAEKLGNMMQALSDAFLNLPVGEIEAAAEGRPATDADKRRTVRDLERLSDQDIQQQIAQAKPMIDHSLKAFAKALPAITKALSDAANEVERATANMPRPDYPRR